MKNENKLLLYKEWESKESLDKFSSEFLCFKVNKKSINEKLKSNFKKQLEKLANEQ